MMPDTNNSGIWARFLSMNWLASPLAMAIAGGLWFAATAIIGLPLLDAIFRRGPQTYGDISQLGHIALVHFALPSFIAGMACANRIVFGISVLESFSLGVSVVFLANIGAGANTALIVDGGHHFWSAFMGIALMYFLTDLLLWGTPFLMGGVAAVLFREVMRYFFESYGDSNP